MMLEPIDNEKPPYAEIINFVTAATDVAMLYSSAHFYRTENNSNILMNIDIGNNLSPIIYMSAPTYLADGTFNATNPVDEISFQLGKNVVILKDLTFFHDILIQYKIIKDDGTNFINQREIRCTLVKEDGSVYDSALFANQQPDSGQHDTILLRGHIKHNLGDIVRIRFQVVQTNARGGQSSTKLNIFRITWNILGLNK